MEFINKYFCVKPKKKRMSIIDVTSLNELLKTGLSIKNCLGLIMTKNNEKVFNEILQKLDGGNLAEEILGDYLPKNISSYCLPLLKTMSFSQSLDLSLSFYNKTQENSKAMEKAILYPFILLFVSLSALYLFDCYGLDSILEMLKSFTGDVTSINVIRTLLRIVVYVFYFGMLIVVCLLLYFLESKNISLFYILVSRYFRDSLIQTYFCEEFISLFIICLDLGYKTKDALDVLKALHNKPIVSLLAFHLDSKLLEGESLMSATKQSYYDSTLSRFINIAIYTNDFNRILSDYITLSRNKITTSMKRLATIIQLSSYLMIGVVVVFIYQILFLPMQAIANF